LVLCIGFSLFIFLLSQIILHDSSIHQKSHFVQQVIAGMISVFDRESERISTITADWAAWDTMYEFAHQPTPALEQNLALARSIKDGDFSLMLVVGKNKEIVRIEGYSHKKKKELHFTQLKEKKDNIWKFVMQTFNREESCKAILQSEFGPMVVVSSAILHSDTSGPQNGRFLIGRIIDDSFAKRIKKVTTWKTQLLMEQLPQKPKTDKQQNWFLEEKEKVLIIYYPMTDIWGQNLFTVQINSRNHSFEILTQTTNLFFLVLLLGIILLGIAIFFIMDRLVVRRVKHISTTTNNIISLDDLSQRINFKETKPDEITQLSLNINRMLERLETENITKEEVERMAMLNEKLIFLGKITAAVSHEINNPIFAIENSLRIIKKHLPLNYRDNHLKEVVDVVEQEIKRVKTIVGNIHNYAIPSIEKTQLTDISTIMKAAIKVIKWSNQQKKTIIHYRQQDRLFPIYSKPQALQQVFINIILNAIEAMEGKGKLIINVNKIENKEEYRIDFIDNGPGIQDSIKSVLFKPFKSSKPGKGTGLGLNISYNIIKNHGGTIFLDENFREGAHVIINIPKGGPRYDGKTNTFIN